MKFHQHLRKSFERLKKDRVFYDPNLKTIVKIISDITHWFDEFAGKRGVDKEGRKYDYTSDPETPVYTQMKHREQRHHYDGLVGCTMKFTAKYGAKFKQIIENEARAHIIEDMGYIPNEDDYKDRNFWINWYFRRMAEQQKDNNPKF